MTLGLSLFSYSVFFSQEGFILLNRKHRVGIGGGGGGLLRDGIGGGGLSHCMHIDGGSHYYMYDWHQATAVGEEEER